MSQSCDASRQTHLVLLRLPPAPACLAVSALDNAGHAGPRVWSRSGYPARNCRECRFPGRLSGCSFLGKIRGRLQKLWVRGPEHRLEEFEELSWVQKTCSLKI